MKNNFLLVLLFSIISNFLLADELDIKAKNITLDKKNNISIFENNVEVIDQLNNLFKADYVEYNKSTDFLLLKGNIYSKDVKGNIFKTEEATYDNDKKIFKSFGISNFETLNGYKVKTSDIFLDNKNGLISSQEKTIIEDRDNNKIYLNNFEYLREKNIFKSVGSIKIIDNLNNSYNFTQIYIDENEKEIIGSDAKLYMNDRNLNRIVWIGLVCLSAMIWYVIIFIIGRLV